MHLTSNVGNTAYFSSISRCIILSLVCVSSCWSTSSLSRHCASFSSSRHWQHTSISCSRIHTQLPCTHKHTGTVHTNTYRRFNDPLRETLKKKRHVFGSSVSPKPFMPPHTFVKKVCGGVKGFGDTPVSKTCQFFYGLT